jgi:uncharacterized protein (TIGR02757 family)
MPLHDLLEQLYSCRSTQHLSNDPLFFCHRYHDPADQEVVGLIASCLAYGNVSAIKRSVAFVLDAMLPSPRRFIDGYHPQNIHSSFDIFKHRFNDARDIKALFWAIKNMVTLSGSIEAFFAQCCQHDALDVTQTLIAVTHDIKSFDYSSVFLTSQIPSDSYFPFFFPSPAAGSACKRLCMYLRWMVRPADGIDLGLWRTILPSQLIIPVDAHIQRITRYLGLTERKSPDWKMALEITAALRKIDPNDPIKYDFALCHLGISEGCSGQNNLQSCQGCVLSSVCSKEVDRA